MARIVLGIGTSHGPMLVTEVEQWNQRLVADRSSSHWWRGKRWTFDELVAARASEELDRQCEPSEQALRRQRCHKAIERLAEVFRGARIDVAIIVGNDQMEFFDAGLVPALSLYCGSHIGNYELTAERLAGLPPGIEAAVQGYIPRGGAVYPCKPDLASFLATALTQSGFDLTVIRAQPKPETPHAFGFVYRHIMCDRPVPSVPLLINTFYPPNQPPAKRCIEFGSALAAAIEGWESSARVAVIASGGLTHFVIDEAFDCELLGAIQQGAIARLGEYPPDVFQSGTSEIKNWLPMVRVMEVAGLKPQVLDYVPCYRSAAGTGNAMGFVSWM